MIEQIPPNPAEQALLDALTSEQLILVADWLDIEKQFRIEEGYRHTDLTWSLTWITRKLRILAQNPETAHHQ